MQEGSVPEAAVPHLPLTAVTKPGPESPPAAQAEAAAGQPTEEGLKPGQYPFRRGEDVPLLFYDPIVL